MHRIYKVYSEFNSRSRYWLPACPRIAFSLLIMIGLSVVPGRTFAQVPTDSLSTGKLKKLSLEELMNIEVMSVSKRPEKLLEAASAIQVITSDDIRRSGAKTLPEVLRLAPNLQVAQINSSQWAISARGFNNILSNKLLVLIDGRTVYTPLYAGVFWDVQNVLLEDIDRIEVISGPGGTLWGANAVNGVINIITKNAKDTRGLFAEGGYGDRIPGFGSLRLGSEISKNLYCRVYGTGFKMGSTVLTDGTDGKDEWTMGQGGFRLDWDASKKDKVTLQGDLYSGNPNPDAATPVIAKGDNVLTRWNHTFSEKSDFQLQVYYDHTFRNFGSGFTENLKTIDIDWQNRFQIGGRNNFTYGIGFRVLDDLITNAEVNGATLGLMPAHDTLYLYSAFAQDEITLIKEHLRLTLGSKVEHNSYTGFEYQPNARLTFTPSLVQTIWAAASRAVKTPSRIDRAFILKLAPTFTFESGSDSFISETVIAYELGWRLQPVKNFSFSIATFYNFYDNIRSAGSGPGIPIIFTNAVKGEAYGIEISATYKPVDWWSIRGGFTHLKKHLWVKQGQLDQNNASAESDDPENQFVMQTYADLPCRLELGAVVRYIDILSKPYVPDYLSLDVQLGWKLNKWIELSVTGQDLLDDRHPEFVPSNPAPREIVRSFYGKITCRI